MKTLIISIVAIFTYNVSQANDIQVKYVWATNGLNIRQAPNTNSKIIGTLNYGESVTQLETTDYTYQTTLLEAKGDVPAVTIDHNWVKVIKEGKVGYVIDGYLLGFIVPVHQETLKEYNRTLKNTYGVKNFEVTKDNPSLDDYVLAIELPKKQTLQFIDPSLEYYGESLFFENFTSQQVLVFINAFYKLDRNGGNFILTNWSEEFNFAGPGYYFEIKDSEEGVAFNLEYEGC